jgi:plastocyanin
VNPIIKLKILTMKARFFLSISALVVATFLIVSCYKSKSSYNSTPGTSKITITSSAYSPASLNVVSGSTVTWTNTDNTIHTVTTEDGTINSGDIAPGASFSKTFMATGTYNYHDAHNTTMMGVLVVAAASSGSGY